MLGNLDGTLCKFGKGSDHASYRIVIFPTDRSYSNLPRFGALKTKPCCFRFDWPSPYCPPIRLQTPEPR